VLTPTRACGATSPLEEEVRRGTVFPGRPSLRSVARKDAVERLNADPAVAQVLPIFKKR
jgi:hypothetical protein